jgi:hypothetical protein
MRGFIVRSFVVPAACAAISLVPGAARALHRETPFELTLSCRSSADPVGTCVRTRTRPIRSPRAPVARWIAFESTTDIMGNGSSGSEIFLFDNNPPRSLKQITNVPTGESHNPSSVANGGTVVFDSTSDLKNQGITAKQIFMWDRPVGPVHAAHERRDRQRAAEDLATGNLVAFQSSADLVGDGTAGTNIYFWQASQICDFNGCRYIRRVTNGPASARTSSPAAATTRRSSSSTRTRPSRASRTASSRSSCTSGRRTAASS